MKFFRRSRRDEKFLCVPPVWKLKKCQLVVGPLCQFGMSLVARMCQVSGEPACQFGGYMSCVAPTCHEVAGPAGQFGGYHVLGWLWVPYVIGLVA